MKSAPAYEIHRAVESFIFDEAALLDAWKLDDWLLLFTDDAKYVVPTTDLPDGDPKLDLVFIDDNMVRLRGRVQRLNSRHAHREYPYSRTRRFVSNIRILALDTDEIDVEASFLVYRLRGEATEPYVGQYRYTLIPNGDGFKIRYRRATLDLETLRSQGAVSIIL
jgi:p-cumate 2,3-dioxygenase subunit beta